MLLCSYSSEHWCSSGPQRHFVQGHVEKTDCRPMALIARISTRCRGRRRERKLIRSIGWTIICLSFHRRICCCSNDTLLHTLVTRVHTWGLPWCPVQGHLGDGVGCWGKVVDLQCCGRYILRALLFWTSSRERPDELFRTCWLNFSLHSSFSGKSILFLCCCSKGIGYELLCCLHEGFWFQAAYQLMCDSTKHVACKGSYSGIINYVNSILLYVGPTT